MSFRCLPSVFWRQMFNLRLLGGLSLAGPDRQVSGRARQPRRLALLTVLAVKREMPVSRDTLLALLWPEMSAERGRHLLSDTLYVLRDALGDDALLTAGDHVSLNAAVVQSDIAAFARALERGEPARAVEIHGGRVFLDGVHLVDCAEFEQWVDSVRAALAGDYCRALEELARAASRRGDHAAAAHRWRELAAQRPLDSRVALSLMRALSDAGDRAGAVAYARDHERFVLAELGCAPDTVVAAFVEEMRAGGRTPAAPASFPPLPAPAAAEPLPPRAPSPREGDTPAAPGRALLRRARLHLGASFFAVLGMTLAGYVMIGARQQVGPGPHPGGAPSGPALDPARVAVIPWQMAGPDSSLLGLGEGIADLLATLLTGDGGLRAVDSRTTINAWRRLHATDPSDGADAARQVARALGAGRLLVGEAVGLGAGRLTLSGRVISVADGEVLSGTVVTGSSDSLPQLLDGFVRDLLSRHAGLAEEHPASTVTTSTEALRAYLAGRAEHRLGRNADAIRSFSRALEHDSTFALAALDLALATGWLIRFGTPQGEEWNVLPLALGTGRLYNPADIQRWRSAIELAWRERDRLSTRERVLLEALRGAEFPRPLRARAVLGDWERAADLAPDRPEALDNLGTLLLHQGLALGLQDSRSRAKAAFQAALALDSSFLPPLVGLIEAAALDRDTRELRRLGALYLARDSTGAMADYIRWRIASLVGDAVTLAALRARLSTMERETLDRIQWASQVSGVALEDADLATREILRHTGALQERRAAIFHAQMLALNRGRPRENLRLLAAIHDLVVLSGALAIVWERRIENGLFGDGDTLAAAQAAGESEAALAREIRRPGLPLARRQELGKQMFMLAVWRLSRGDTAGVAEAIARSRSIEWNGFRDEHADVLEAGLAVVTRRSDAADRLAELDSMVLLGCCGPKWLGLLAARLHLRLDDPAGALRMVRAGKWIYAPYHWSAHLREEGRLAAVTGDLQGAIRAYRHYLALRSSPEPELRPEAERIRAELRRLQRELDRRRGGAEPRRPRA